MPTLGAGVSKAVPSKGLFPTAALVEAGTKGDGKPLQHQQLISKRNPKTSLQSVCNGHTRTPIVCTIAPSGDFGHQIVFPWHHITLGTTFSPAPALPCSIIFSDINPGAHLFCRTKNSRHDSSLLELILPNSQLGAGVTQYFDIPMFQQIWILILFPMNLLGVWHIRHHLPKAWRVLTAHL